MSPRSYGTSNSVTFTVRSVPQNPVPVLTSISPTYVDVGSPDTQISVYGSGFVAGVTQGVIGTQGLSTLVVSTTELAVTVPASYLTVAGTLPIGVFNAAPGGGYSATAPLTVGTPNPVPTLVAVAPTAVVAGAATFTLAFTLAFAAR